MSACLDYIWACRRHWKTKVSWDAQRGNTPGHRERAENRFSSTWVIKLHLHVIAGKKKPSKIEFRLSWKEISTNVRSEHVKKATHHRNTWAGPNRIGWSEVWFLNLYLVENLKDRSSFWEWRHRRVACRNDERRLTGRGCCVCSLVVSHNRVLLSHRND